MDHIRNDKGLLAQAGSSLHISHIIAVLSFSTTHFLFHLSKSAKASPVVMRRLFPGNFTPQLLAHRIL